VFALIGENMKNGFKLAFEQAGDFDGRKVEILVEDEEAKVDVAIAKVRKLVSSDQVHMLVGGVASSVGLAIRDFADTNRIPYICTTGTAAIEFISTKKSRWMKHPWIAANLFGGHLPSYMVKQLGAKQVVTMAPDYAWGHSEVQWVKASAEQAGGKVIQTILTPFPTLDFSPYMGQLKNGDVFIANYAGADAPRLVKQFREYGIKMLFAGGGTFTPETVEVMGKDAVGC
jgi:branched-chain amino acid transport system substrate-binding protein